MTEQNANPTDLEWVFSGLLIDMLQRGRRSEDTQTEAEYIQRLLQLPKGAKILDVPCGNGRISVELAARGYQVTGVDFSERQIEAARRLAAERQLGGLTAFEQRDMRDLPWQNEFDAAICLWESFGYFDDAGNVAFARAAWNALKPGGRFVIDTHVAESMFPRLVGRQWSQVNDLIVLEERGFDHIQGRLLRNWIIINAGKIDRRVFSMRLYNFRELCLLLLGVGFAGFESYAYMRFTPFEFGSQRLMLVATKGAASATPAAESK